MLQIIELKKYDTVLWNDIIEVFGLSFLTDINFYSTVQDVTIKYFGPHEFKYLIFMDDDKLVGFLPILREDLNPGQESLSPHLSFNWWEIQGSLFLSNLPLLILPEYIDEALRLVPGPFRFDDQHPEIKSDKTFHLITGAVKLNCADDFLSSLNTKKRSYLKKRSLEEDWSSFNFEFIWGSLPQKSMWLDAAGYWRDKDLSSGYTEKDCLDSFNKILHDYDILRFLCISYPSVLLSTHMYKGKERIGINVSVHITSKYLGSQICSIIFLRDKYDGSNPTHALHFANINHFFNNTEIDWYCLGPIVNEYGTYKTHFRNGDFSTIVGTHINSGTWIPDYIKPPICLNNEYITTDEPLQVKTISDSDEDDGDPIIIKRY